MPKPMTPTATEKTFVNSVVAEQRRIYQEYKRVILQLRRMRTLRLSNTAPRAFQRIIGRGVRVPMAWSLIQTVVGLLTKNDPKFKRVPRNPGDKAAAIRLAQTGLPLIETYSRLARKPIFILGCDSLAADGRVVAKLKRTLWEDYPAREGGEADAAYNKRVEDYLSEQGTARRELPFRLALVDPTTFWPSRDDEHSFIVESGKRPLLTTLKSLGVKFGTNNSLVPVPVGATLMDMQIPSGMSPSAQVDQLWTDNEVFTSVNGEILKFENELGFIPYRERYGMVTSIQDPLFEGVSVIYPFAGVEPWLNTLFSQIITWSILGGTPILAVTQPAGPNMPVGEEIPATDLPLGKQITLTGGRRAEFLVPPPVGQAVLQAVDMLLSIYERAGITSMARGNIGTRTPGMTFSAALEAASDMFTPLVIGLQGFLEDIIEMTWRGSEALDMPLWVTGHSLEPVALGLGRRKVLAPFKVEPKDIDGYYDIHCELSLNHLQDTINRGLHAAMMKAHKLWGEERSMEYSGVDEPDAERIELLKDTIRKSGPYQERALRLALEDDPELKGLADEVVTQGGSVLDLLAEAKADADRVYDGAPQPRGANAPRGGGRSKGAPRRPGGGKGRAAGQPQNIPSP